MQQEIKQTPKYETKRKNVPDRIKFFLAQKRESLIALNPSDEEEGRSSRLFITLIEVSIGICILLHGMFLFMKTFQLSSAEVILMASVFPFVFILFSIFCLVQVKAQRMYPTISIYVVVNFLSIAAAAFVFDGTVSPAWVLFIWPTAIAGVLLSPIYSIRMIVISVFYFFVLFVLARLNIYEPIYSFGTEGREFLMVAFQLIMLVSTAGFLTYLNMQGFHIALGRLKKETTGRKKAEEALRESEIRFRTLVEQSPFSTQVFRVDGSVITINKAYCELWGADEKDANFIINNYNVLKDEQLEAAGLMQYIKKAFGGEFTEIPVVEYDPQKTEMVSSTDLHKRWVIGYMWPVVDDNGEIIEVVLMHEDVTERKRAEQALRESENFRRTIIESEPECVKIVTIDGIILDMNPAGLRMLEAESLNEIKGKSVYRVLPAKWHEVFRKLSDKISKGESVVEEFEILGIKGSRKWVETHAVPLHDKNSKIYAQLAITRDITQRKQAEEDFRLSEERYRRLFNVSPVGVILEDSEGNILDVNEAFCKDYGYTREELIGKNVMILVPLQRREAVFDNIKKILNGQFLEHEALSLRKDGELRYIQLKETRIKLPDGRFGILSIENDITERRAAEEALKESEARFKILAESTSSAIFIYDQKFNYINPSGEKLLGYTQEELLNMNFWDVVHPDFKELIKERGNARLRGEKVTPRYEFKIKKKSGDERWIDFSASRIQYKGGNAAIGTAFDITERKHAEEALQQRFRLEQLISTFSANLVKSSSLTLNSIINNALKFLGEALHIDRTYVFQFNQDRTTADNTHEWCAEGIEPQIEKMKGIPTERFPWWMERMNRFENILIPSVEDLPDEAAAEKEILLMQNIQSILAVPMVYSNMLMGFVGFDSVKTKRTWSEEDISILKIVTDVVANALVRNQTEVVLRQSEEQYRNLFEGIPIGLYHTSLEGKLIRANRAMIDLLGYPDIESLRQINVSEMYVDHEARLNIQEELRLQGLIKGAEIQLKRYDGKIVWVRDTSHVVCDSAKKNIYYEGGLEDITEQKRAEEELIIAKEKAEISDKLKSEFLAQMSHEIRSPINIILSFAGLLRDEIEDKLDESLKESFTAIENAGKRIIRTINLILNMSEIHVGVYELKPKKFDIDDDVIRLIHAEYHHIAKTKNLDFKVKRLTEHADIFADEYSVSQIISNLVDNAIKYTKEGYVEIIIRRDASERLCVDVCDSGIGISEEYLPKIFNVFSQEEQGYTRPYEGNGLGLALVKKYVELNNAEIVVESKKGAGSKFTVTF
ncbi:MAG: PAS domain S-box protein [Ignavibacteriales bacterium]|nr:PAS domain S-box protein [Ignavibacteriales bacterium]